MESNVIRFPGVLRLQNVEAHPRSPVKLVDPSYLLGPIRRVFRALDQNCDLPDKELPPEVTQGDFLRACRDEERRICVTGPIEWILETSELAYHAGGRKMAEQFQVLAFAAIAAEEVLDNYLKAPIDASWPRVTLCQNKAGGKLQFGKEVGQVYNIWQMSSRAAINLTIPLQRDQCDMQQFMQPVALDFLVKLLQSMNLQISTAEGTFHACPMDQYKLGLLTPMLPDDLIEISPELHKKVMRRFV